MKTVALSIPTRNHTDFALFTLDPKRHNCRSQQPRGLSRRSAAARLLRLWVRIPPGARMSVCCECCVLSGRGLCDDPITRPEESYRLRLVIVCDLETSRKWRPWPTGGWCAKKNVATFFPLGGLMWLMSSGRIVVYSKEILFTGFFNLVVLSMGTRTLFFSCCCCCFVCVSLHFVCFVFG